MWPIKFAILGLFSLHIVHSVRRKRIYQKRYPPNYIYILLLLFFIFSLYSFQVYNPYINTNASYGYKLLIVFACICLFAIQLTRFFSVETNQKALYSAMISGGAVITYSNLFLYLIGVNLGRGAGRLGGEGGIGRFSGWLDNPNTLGIILLGTFPIILQSALKRNKWVSYESVLVTSMLLLLFLTGSRSTLLGMAIMAAILLWTHSRKTKNFAILVILLATLLSLFDPGAMNSTSIAKYSPQFSRQGTDVLSGRSFAWEIGLQLIQEKPFFGFGFGTEGLLLERFVPVTAVHQGKYFHNSYISLLISSGLIGGGPMLILLAIAIKKALRVFGRTSKNNDHFTSLMGTLFLGFLVHAFFETWIFSPGSVYCFFFWFTCFWLLSEKKRPAITKIKYRNPFYSWKY